jgi:hypothetical protein
MQLVLRRFHIAELPPLGAELSRALGVTSGLEDILLPDDGVPRAGRDARGYRRLCRGSGLAPDLGPNSGQKPPVRNAAELHIAFDRGKLSPLSAAILVRA